MSSGTPVNVKTNIHNNNTSSINKNSPNNEDPYVQIIKSQPNIELNPRSPPSSPIRSPLRQRIRRATESYEDLIGGQATFEVGQGSSQEISWTNVEPISPLPYTSDSTIPNSPNNLSSPNSPDYDISTPESIWNLIYRHAGILDAHTEQLKGLRPTQFEWYDRNLDALFKRADAERRTICELGIKINEIKNNTNQELGSLDSRVRCARREHGQTHVRIGDIERTLWMARDAARNQGQKIAALESMLANQMNMCQERFSIMEAAQLELEKEIRYLRQRRN